MPSVRRMFGEGRPLKEAGILDFDALDEVEAEVLAAKAAATATTAAPDRPQAAAQAADSTAPMPAAASGVEVAAEKEVPSAASSGPGHPVPAQAAGAAGFAAAAAPVPAAPGGEVAADEVPAGPARPEPVQAAWAAEAAVAAAPVPAAPGGEVPAERASGAASRPALPEAVQAADRAPEAAVAAAPLPAAPGGEAAALQETAGQRGDRGGGGGTIDVVARHAIAGIEVTVTLPERARFKHIKAALAKRLGSDEILERGQLMKKDGGIYSAFKDSKKIGDVRRVLVVCADFSAVADEAATCSLAEDEVSSDDEAKPAPAPPLLVARAAAGGPPAGAAGAAAARPTSSSGSRATAAAEPAGLTRTRAIAMQQELLEGFSAAEFQRELRALVKQRNGGVITSTAFMQARQDLFLTVQRVVLPRHGFDGSVSGVYKMMGAMGPFIKDPEFVELATRINALIGLDSPPETWGDLSRSCQKLEAASAPGGPPPGSSSPSAKPKPKGLASSRFGFGFGGTLLGGFAAPPKGFGLFAAPPRVLDEVETLSEGIRSTRSGQAAPLQPAAAAGQPAAGSVPQPWPAGRPPPFKLYVAGSFNSFSPSAMDWDEEGALFICPVQVGASGVESFQLLVNGSWEKTLYPSTADAGPFQAHEVLGPDGKGHGRNWRIGRFEEEQVKPLQNLVILAAVDSRGKVFMVDWQPF